MWCVSFGALAVLSLDIARPAASEFLLPMLFLFTTEAFYKYSDPTQHPPVDLIPLLSLMGLGCIINSSRLLSDCAKTSQWVVSSECGCKIWTFSEIWTGIAFSASEHMLHISREACTDTGLSTMYYVPHTRRTHIQQQLLWWWIVARRPSLI